MQRKQPGFSLIEAAIVLGIIGLVIGGIWLAAAAANDARKASEMEAGFLQMVRGIENIHKGQTFPSAGTDLTPLIVSAKLAPSSWIREGTLYNPWGGQITVTSATLSGRESYYLTIYDISARGCTKLVTRASAQHSTGTGTAFDIYYAPTYTVGMSAGFPSTLDQIAIWCGVVNQYQVRIRLRFHFMR